MALMIVSTGTLANSRLRTLRLRTLAAGVGVLAVGGLVGGLALGFHLGSTLRPGALPNLDPSQPGNQAIIQLVGTLSGRMIQLEALASRLSQRTTGKAVPAAVAPVPAGKPPAAVPGPANGAGGPLVDAEAAGGGPDTAAALLLLERELDRVEERLAVVDAAYARRDVDAMAFPSRLPVLGVPISSGFGHREDPFTGQIARHTGYDYPAAPGTSILASAGGRVRVAGPHGAYGNTVEIDHGAGLVTRYGHASRVLVKVGDILLPGQPIALVGSTGRSTGPHLHFEVIRNGLQVNPGLYLARGAR
jgi:murein DD-endopeptidase MepM/ murein hydrolase activator NlpD